MMNMLMPTTIPANSTEILGNEEILEQRLVMQFVSMYVNTSLAAQGALAHRLQCRTICKIQNGHYEAPKWPTGSGKVSNHRFLGAPVNFC